MKDYELLEKQVDMMRMAEKHGVDHWMKLVKLNLYSRLLYDHRKVTERLEEPLECDADYSWSLGVVEGKAVFEGDSLWFIGRGPVKPRSIVSEKVVDGSVFTSDGAWIGFEYLSWIQPKPKTVTTEMLVDDAATILSVIEICKEYCASNESANRVHELLSKALESIK